MSDLLHGVAKVGDVGKRAVLVPVGDTAPSESGVERNEVGHDYLTRMGIMMA